jgi:hypothetical protein
MQLSAVNLRKESEVVWFDWSRKNACEPTFTSNRRKTIDQTGFT